MIIIQFEIWFEKIIVANDLEGVGEKFIMSWWKDVKKEHEIFFEIYHI